MGLYLLCKDEEGIRGFRNIAKNYRPKTNWIKLSSYLRKFEDEIFSKPLHGFINDIEKAINEFRAFKIDKEFEMLNCLVNNCKVKYNKHMENLGFYTAKELAKKVRVNIMTIYRYIKAGKLKAYKIGKEFRIGKRDFQKFLDKMKI